MTSKRRKWTKWELSKLTNIYPSSSDDDLSKSFPQRTLKSVKSKASNLGLTKEKEPSSEVPEEPKSVALDPITHEQPQDAGTEIKVDGVIDNLSELSSLAVFPVGQTDNLTDIQKFYSLFGKVLETKHGINLKDVGAKLGSGTMGTAYEYKNVVLKATRDISEAFASAALIGKGIKGVVTTYKVILFPKKEGGKYKFVSESDGRPMMGFVMAWILEERLRPLDPKVKKILKRRLSKFKKYMGGKLSYFLREYFKKKISRGTLEKTFMRLWRNKELYPGFWRALEGMAKQGVKFYDVHVPNLMQNAGGTIHMVDIGYSISENRKGAEVISLEALMRKIKMEKIIKGAQ